MKDLISNLEKAQGTPLVDSNKFGVLRESMRVEKRDKINMAFNHACLANQSFNETLDSILKVWNNIPTNTVSNRIAAVTTDGEEKICFRFNQGLCKNKNCKYLHKIMSERQKKSRIFKQVCDVLFGLEIMHYILIQDPLNKEHTYLIFRVVSQ